MSALEQRIDALYQLPLSEFTASRNALAKEVGGAGSARLKRLEKPTLVAWVVNQLYWRDRATWTRLMRAGQTLRTAQINVLEGRAADVRGAAADHRATLAVATERATALCAEQGARPAADQLARMLEAVSLSAEAPVAQGRWTELLQPSGLNALAGLTPSATPSTAAQTEATLHAARRHAAEAAVAESERDLGLAVAANAGAQARADLLRTQLDGAESDCARLRAGVDATRAARERARLALADLDARGSR